jgi:hypothetical protein
MDLFQLAADNRLHLEERFTAMKATLAPAEADRLGRFATMVDEFGRISINMRQTTLLSFLTFGSHQHMYEWARSRAAHSSMPADAIMKERMKGFYEHRVFFDTQFDGANTFQYGALNIGGLGATAYGDFCLVLDDHVSSDRPRIAYLRSDSLKAYVGPGPILDQDSLNRDIAPHSHRQMLAALKHSSEILAFPQVRWPSILCNASQYVEAIITGGVTRVDIEAVRMDKLDYDLFFEFAFQDFRSKLADADRFRIDMFVLILQLLEDHHVPLELINHA